MVQENQKWDKILGLIYEYPNKEFTIREISRKSRIPSSTVQRYIKILKKKNFIDNENRAIVTPYFKFSKAYYLINKIHTSGLVDYLIKEFIPSAIIVFGSIRKGEYEKDSDIDIFIETHKKEEPNLKKYEKVMGHKIQLFLKSDINNAQPNLFNNLVNGIKLYGSFTIKNKKND